MSISDRVVVSVSILTQLIAYARLFFPSERDRQNSECENAFTPSSRRHRRLRHMLSNVTHCATLGREAARGGRAKEGRRGKHGIKAQQLLNFIEICYCRSFPMLVCLLLVFVRLHLAPAERIIVISTVRQPKRRRKRPKGSCRAQEQAERTRLPMITKL